MAAEPDSAQDEHGGRPGLPKWLGADALVPVPLGAQHGDRSSIVVVTGP